MFIESWDLFFGIQKEVLVRLLKRQCCRFDFKDFVESCFSLIIGFFECLFLDRDILLAKEAGDENEQNPDQATCSFEALIGTGVPFFRDLSNGRSARGIPPPNYAESISRAVRRCQ